MGAHVVNRPQATFVRQDDRSEQRESQMMTSPRTQNPIQYWQLRKHLTVEQAAEIIGILRDRYLEIVVSGNEHFTREELQRLLSATAITEDKLRAWEQRPKGDTRNPAAR